jgi:hypothetical protein
MAILLSNTGGTQQAPSLFRQWISKILFITVTGCTVSDASPLVVTKSGHGFCNGDVVFGSGAVNNPNANGPNQVLYVSAATFKLVPLGYPPLLSANAVNGGGSAADTDVSFTRAYINLQPHDLLNMQTTLSRMSYAKDSDLYGPPYPGWGGYPNESPIVTLLGGPSTH